MKTSWLLICLACLASCTGHTTTAHAPSSNGVHKVSCSEFNTDQAACRAQAEARCPNGIARITHFQEDYEDQGDGFVMHTQHHYTVQCKP